MSASKNLINGYRTIVSDFTAMLQNWPQSNLEKTMPDGTTTYRQVLVRAIRSNYDLLELMQKTAGVPRIPAPEAVATLGQLDMDKMRRMLDFLGPYANEAFSAMADEKLNGRTLTYQGSKYTIQQAMDAASEALRDAKNKIQQAEQQH